MPQANLSRIGAPDSERAGPSAREAITHRLCEIVSWPESKVPVYERQLAADILVGLLRTSSVALRAKCAGGLTGIHDAPKALLRYLARDEIGVSRHLLEQGKGFDDSDLIATIRAGVAVHWSAIARRRGLNEAVTDALLQTGDAATIEAVLKNGTARLSTYGIDLVVARSRRVAQLCPLLISRAELRPTQALVLFWWAGYDVRVQILRRFAVDRGVLIDGLLDAFALAAAEGWTDAEARKTMQLIERRQRNRAAAAQSPHGSLEGVLAAAEHGLDEELANEMAYLSGLKPATLTQILADPGGEAIAVFCKSVGLKRPMLLALWKALRRPAGDPDMQDNSLGRTCYVFDTLATAKAQTVLRYWNWSFTSDVAGLDQSGHQEEDSNSSVARRNATLLLSRNA